MSVPKVFYGIFFGFVYQIDFEPGLNPYFETNGDGTLCRERNCKWRGDERDGIRTSFVEWRSSD
jgi:hypothetical protein